MKKLAPIAIALAAVANPALAGPTDEIRVFAMKHVGDTFIIEVPYNDLDLRQPAEVKILSTRVNRAIRQVCAPRLYNPSLSEYGVRACIEQASSETDPQLWRARKRALEFARTGYSSMPEVAIAVRVGF